MVIQHNLLAEYAMSNLNNKTRIKGKSMEKLSSGYKINRSADDAAGLSISEKMRRQMRGLKQASDNSEDGISMVQIADGALAEVQDMLHRGTELSVKAANGTLSDDDREDIQAEIEQLKQEIDAVAERTKFNEIQVLKGYSFRPEIPFAPGGEMQVEGGTWAPGIVADPSNGTLRSDYAPAASYVDPIGGRSGTVNPNHPSATLTFNMSDPSELDDQAFYITECAYPVSYTIKLDANSAVNSVEEEYDADFFRHSTFNVGIANCTSGDDVVNSILNAIGNIDGTGEATPSGGFMHFKDEGGGTLRIYDGRTTDPVLDGTFPFEWPDFNWTGWRTDDTHRLMSMPDTASNLGIFGAGQITLSEEQDFSPEETVYEPGLTIHAGSDADAEDKIGIKLPAISTEIIGLSKTDVTVKPGGPEKAIDDFKNALFHVNTDRSRMGAYQNRLEHTIKNLDNVIENTTAAESRLRDTDMASEMVKYSNVNILEQAGQSVLSQANQSRQGILSLLS